MLTKSSRGPLAWKSRIRPRQSSANIRYLTLDLASDCHARAAIEAYADSCAAEIPWLADILRARLETLNHLATGVQNSFAGLPQDQAEAIPITHCAHTARRLMSFACMCARAQDDYSGMAWEHVMKSFDRMLLQMR